MPAATDKSERGPIRFVVEATPQEAWIGDPISIALRADTPDDLLVRFPDAKEFGEWNVRSVSGVEWRPAADGGRTWSQIVVVDSLTSGAKEIPPLVMKYGKQPADGAAPSFDNELAIGTLKLTIRSALTSQDSVSAPRDITAIRTPQAEPLRWWQIVFAVCAAALVAGIAHATWRALRGLAGRSASPISAETWALRALNDLERSDWALAGLHREYYYRMSEIVRGYVESKFGFHAPEMTTEEFLGALARDKSALPYDAEKLGRFLSACDMVKYAALAPSREDALDALSTARAFVDATAAAAELHARERAAQLADESRRERTRIAQAVVEQEQFASVDAAAQALIDGEQRWQGPQKAQSDGGRAA